MKNTKLKFGVWYGDQTWHIVKKIPNKKIKLKFDTVAICNNNIWIDYYPSKDYTLPNGKDLEHALTYFDLNHICKSCIKIVSIEKIKTYIIYHKLGIKQ